MDENGIAAARRGVDAAVGARGGEHAERRHRDEFPGMRVDFRTRFCKHARRGLLIDLLEIAGGAFGQGFSPVRDSARISARARQCTHTASAGTKQLMMMLPR